VFDVLLHLIRHRDHLVSKDEPFQVVWNGRIVSEATLTSRISAARRAIGGSGERQNYLRTIARQGFRLCRDVEEHGTSQSLPAASGATGVALRAVDETASNLPAQSNEPSGPRPRRGRQDAARDSGRERGRAELQGLRSPCRRIPTERTAERSRLELIQRDSAVND